MPGTPRPRPTDFVPEPDERPPKTLAAQGASNAEIAQELVVTRRTVESHLTSAHRKLGIKRRGDLAAALAADS